MAKKPAEVVLKQPEEAIPVEILAEAITAIAKGMKRVLASGLKNETLVTLLHDSSKVGKPQIRAVLSSLESFDKDFLTGKPKKS